jgi:hypothetical protein
MKLSISVLVVAASLALAGAASAHDGNIWFTTSKSAQASIKDKYFVSYAGCFGSKRFGHKWTKGFKTMWDHFACLVHSDITDRNCTVLAHMTGQKWYQIVLTSYKTGDPDYPTCTPRDLRQR